MASTSSSSSSSSRPPEEPDPSARARGEGTEQSAQESLEEKDASDKNSMFFQALTPSQEERYTHFRSAMVQKNKVKRVMQTVVKEGEINDRIALVMSGITKVYLGELVETARTVMTDWGHIGPIRRCHVREAYRRMRKEGRATNLTMRRKAFKRL